MYIVLSEFSKDRPLYRLIRIGKKKLPSTKYHNRFWGIVEEVTEDVNTIGQLLIEENYTTITQGERTVSACRPAGEGLYAIVQAQNSTHLAYVLELPQDIGDVQKAFNIEKEGSFFLVVKNPNIPSQNQGNVQSIDMTQPGLPNPNISRVIPVPPFQPILPQRLQEMIGGKIWTPAIPKEILNYKGIEMVIIGESNNLVKEFGKTGKEIEEEERIEASHLNDVNLFEELRLDKAKFPVEPLLYGQWK